jgi:hypothetical protein
MMRAHGIAPNAASIKPAPQRTLKTESNSYSSSNPKPASHTPSTSTSASKKRKTDAFLEDQAIGDDDEGFGNGNCCIKSEPEYGGDMGKGKEVIKKELEDNTGTMETKMQMQHTEAMGQLSLDEAANLMQYYDSPATYHGSGLGDGAELGRGHGHIVEEAYRSSGFGEGASGYGGSMVGVGAYGLHSQHPSYDFPVSYGGRVGAASMGMSSLDRSESVGQGMQDQSAMQMQYSGNQRRLDSPVIIE